jgi:hypothetical protein
LGVRRAHRQWKTRSYAVSLMFLEVRLILGLTGLDQPFNWAIAETVVWSCFALAVPLGDVANQWHELAARPRPVKVRATAMALATPGQARALPRAPSGSGA